MELTPYYHTERRGIVWGYRIDLGIVSKLGRAYVVSGQQELEPEPLPPTKYQAPRNEKTVSVRRRIIDLLNQFGPMTQDEIVRRLEIPQVTISYNLRYGPFVKAGQVQRRGGTAGRPSIIWRVGP